MEKGGVEVTAGPDASSVVLPNEPHDSNGRGEWPHWPSVVPTLVNGTTTLRELCEADAPSLLALISTEQVSEFISTPPTTLEGYQAFIRWSHRRRAERRLLCFGVVPGGFEAAVGIFQLQVPPDRTPEWGFALGSSFWGTGLFRESAEAVLDFAFRGMGLTELAARAAVDNRRGNAALEKIGAVRARVIPNGLSKDGRTYDETYWTVSADRRPPRKVTWT